MTHRGWFGLHTSIWKIASTHVIVDAYTNIYAPLLPLLIPHLNLSLKTAGIIAMCFQMANSVSQLGFGALADKPVAENSIRPHRARRNHQIPPLALAPAHARRDNHQSFSNLERG